MATAHRIRSSPHRLRGTTLVEALIAFVVLSFGMLAAAQVQTHLRLNAELTRQRAEAVRLGQDDLERLRAFANATGYASIADATTTVSGDGSGALRYTIERHVDAGTYAHAKTVAVTVGWTSRDDIAQSIALHSVIAEADPANAGSLALPPAAPTAEGAYGRSIGVPVAAADLGDGRSALKPVEAGNVALVLDNATGAVVGRCTGVNPATPTRGLAPGNLAGCDATAGLLLSGTVRFTTSARPDPGIANDAPPALDISLALGGSTSSSRCDSEARKTVRYVGPTGLRVDSVPIDATPASLGLASWTDTGDRHVAYHCAVYPAAGGRWSGSATIVPHGWTIGAGAADRRVCRYSADLDGNGAIDANLEHPPTYTNVGSALAHQDFLVIAGSSSCPTASPVRITGGGDDVLVNLGTLPHQP